MTFSVRTDAKVLMGCFCHCESCRRAHAAPLYQVCYVQADGFKLTAGREHVKHCSELQ